MLTSFFRKLYRFLFGSKISLKENLKLFFANWYKFIKRSAISISEKTVTQVSKLKGLKNLNRLNIIKETLMVSKDYKNLPKVRQTPNQIKISLKQDPKAISMINDLEHHKDLIKEEIIKNWENIQYLPSPHKELINTAVNIDCRALDLIDKNWINTNMNDYELTINKLVKSNPSFILNIKEPLESTVRAMLLEDNSNIKYLNQIQQQKYKTLIDRALLREPNMIVHVHQPTVDQMVAAINYNYRLFNSIQDKCNNQAIDSLLKTDMRIYKNLPNDLKIKHQETYNRLLADKEVSSKIAELINRRSETIFDFYNPTDKMIKMAVTKEPSLYSKFSQTQTLTTQLLELNSEVIKFVDNPTDNDYRRAFNKNPMLVNYFLQNDNALKIAVTLDHKNLLLIPLDQRTGEIAEVAIQADPMNILHVKANAALYFKAISHSACSLDLLQQIPKSKITDKMLQHLKKENPITYLKYIENNKKIEKTEFSQMNQKKISPETNKTKNLERSLIIN